MRLVLTENDFKGLLTEMVKEVLLEDNNKDFFERVIHQYLAHFGGTRGSLPSCSREELTQYIDRGLRLGYNWAKNNDFVKSPENFIFQVQNNLLSQLKFNKRGLIYVERTMKFNKDQPLFQKFNNGFDDEEDEYNKPYYYTEEELAELCTEEELAELKQRQKEQNLQNMYYKSVGECWSFKPHNGRSYCNKEFGSNIYDVTLHGYIHPKYIDWVATLYLNVWDMSYETEIRTNNSSWVEVTDVTVNDMKYHLPKSYIVKADTDKYSSMVNYDVNDSTIQGKVYSINNEIHIDRLLQQGTPLDDIFIYSLPLSMGYYKVSLGKNQKWNILNTKTNKVLFGNINNSTTWIDDIKQCDYHIILLRKKNKYTLYNYLEERFLLINKNNQPIWCDDIKRLNDTEYHITVHYKENIFDFETQNVVYGDMNNPNTWCGKIQDVGGYYRYIINVNNKYNIISHDSHILEGKLDDIDTWFDDIITFYKMKFFITKKSDKYQIRSFNNSCKLVTDILFDNFKIIDNDARLFRRRKTSDCFLKLYSQGKEYILTPIDYSLGCKIQPSNNIAENKNKRK